MKFLYYHFDESRFFIGDWTYADLVKTIIGIASQNKKMEIFLINSLRKLIFVMNE